MPSRSFFGAILLLILAGCHPEPVSVYVDRRLIRPELEPQIEFPKMPSPPKPKKADSLAIPGSPALALSEEERSQANRVQAELEADRNRAIEQLTKRLQTVYAKEVAAARIVLRQELLDETESARKAYTESIRTIFEQYAEKRGPILLRITVLNGFPDLLLAPTKDPSEYQKKKQDELEALRQQLAELDREYNRVIGQVAAQNSAVPIEKAREIAEKLANLQAAANRRAEEDARRQVRQISTQLQLRLAKATRVTLPGVPGKVVSRSAESRMKSPPEVTSAVTSQDNARREFERDLEVDLRIWAGLNNFRLVASPTQGRNATAEFLRWRNEHRLGRLPKLPRSSAE